MRIGILTFHRCINYGSYWQARCLAEGIAARGHDVVLLDHRSCEVTSREWRYAFQPLLPARSNGADIARYGDKLRRFLHAFAELPLSAPFALDDPAAMPRVDLAIIGSDEVLNLSHPWYGGRDIFYGAGLNAARTITYAASFGNYDASAGLDPARSALLRNLDAISVRDENSRQLVSGATGTEPAMVLDPVLQFPPKLVPVAGEAPYILVYGHHIPDWFAERITAAARRRHLRTVSVGYRNDWADAQRLEAGPAEFASLVAGAEAVATTYFHGCVFALVSGRPFACAPSDYRWTKIRDLTALLNAERHLTFEDRPSGDVDALLAEPIASEVKDRIMTLRAESNAWLDRALA